MAYVGQSISIPLGQQALLTDLPATQTPATALTKANNVAFEIGGIKKDAGSTKFNATALDSGSKIIGLWDWHPDGSNQRTIAITASGKVFRDTGDGSFTAGVAIDTSYGTPSLDLLFVEAGNETALLNKKLFVFSNTRRLGFIDGDATTITNVTDAADWSGGNNPTGGFVFGDKLIAFGNPNFPHQLYITAAGTHDVFTTGVTLLPVFPGENDAIVTGIVFRGFALLFKRPWGVYVLNSNNSGTATDWSITRLDKAFGIASPHAAIQVLGDLLVANNVGSINSLTATQATSDLEAGDILSNAEIENFIRTNFDKSGISSTQSIYYSEKKRAYFTLRGKGNTTQDSMLVIDLNKPQVPRYSIDNRNVPESLALRRDSDDIQRPIFGDANGFVFLMDQGVQSVDGAAYVGEFQTPEIDFAFLDPSLAFKNKLFDFLSVTLVGRDTTAILVDVFLDGDFSETISIVQATGALLGTFLLGTDSLREIRPRSVRRRLHGQGKRIQLRFFTTGIDNFEIQNITLDFRLGNEGAEKE